MSVAIGRSLGRLRLPQDDKRGMAEGVRTAGATNGWCNQPLGEQCSMSS